MKNGAKMLRVLLILLVAFAVVYLVAQTVIIWRRPTETVLAERSTLSDSVECRGAMGMTETLVTYDGTGVLNYLLPDGSRVSAGTQVAEVFATHEQARDRVYLTRIEEKLSILEKSNVTAEATDVSLLYRQMRSTASDILTVLESGELSGLPALRDSMELSANKAAHATGDGMDFSARIAELEAQKTALAQTPLSVISAPVSGYFVSADESARQLYTTEQLREMMPAQLAETVAQESPANDDLTAGKVIQDYEWYFFATVDAASNRFVEGASVTISFPDASSESYPATVVGVTLDEEAGLAKVELSCDYTSGVVLSLEHTDAVITFKTYEGLLIPKSAIRIVDDQRGVYVKTGNLARFCAVTPIYESETEILVPLETEDGVNEVRMYDTVIVSGRDLYDGKIVS